METRPPGLSALCALVIKALISTLRPYRSSKLGLFSSGTPDGQSPWHEGFAKFFSIVTFSSKCSVGSINFINRSEQSNAVFNASEFSFPSLFLNSLLNSGQVPWIIQGPPPVQDFSIPGNLPCKLLHSAFPPFLTLVDLHWTRFLAKVFSLCFSSLSATFFFLFSSWTFPWFWIPLLFQCG